MITKICRNCRKKLSIKKFGSNGKTPKGTAKYKPRCKPCNYTYELKIAKEKLKSIMGDLDLLKCSACGYHKCFSALIFHHVDPSQKDRNIGHMRNYSEKKLKKEISKCDILCANCHIEKHEKLRRL